MTPRRAAIVVLCWNRWELTRRCLETLKAHTNLAEAEVIAVDNGSTDETPARLAGMPWVRVVTSATNLGYVRGNNAGIAAAPPDADVVLLNNDLEIHQDGWLDALREAAYAAPDVGIAGCRLVLPDGRLLHAGTYILPDTFWGQQIGALETGLWFCTAFGGHGLNTTAIGGRIIAEAITGQSDRYRLFAPFGLAWNGGPVGRLAVQTTYWSLQARDRLNELRR